MLKLSPTYANILDMLFKTKGFDSSVHTIDIDGTTITRTKTGLTSRRLNQEITITDTALFEKCTTAEWYLIGLISSQLKQYNALWYCDNTVKKSGNLYKALKTLIDKKILVKTETPHIYFVNPMFIRRGGFYEVLMSTAEILSNSSKVTTDHIINKKPIQQITIPQIAEYKIEESVLN